MRIHKKMIGEIWREDVICQRGNETFMLDEYIIATTKLFPTYIQQNAEIAKAHRNYMTNLNL